MSIESAENATARPELVGVSPSASLKGSGAGKQRASDAKARRARHVGSMSLDEKLRLLEEVAAALKDQGTNSSRSGAPIHSSVPPSTPEGGSDPSDIEMGDSDEIDDLMEMTASTEVYDSDTDVVPPAAGLRRCHAMAMVVQAEDMESNGREHPEPEPDVASTTNVSNGVNGRKRTQDEDEDEDENMKGISVPPVAVAYSPVPVFKKVKSNAPNRPSLA
ncbi:hypothetical protein EW026_g4857 [Hermanssonia centrifuga]|uniref:Uncharacterized protein n=1 Tax=Hermanssonia centrifuga TaxID=98765 RepID=A0A4S4KFX5_9APHY|nr:hypothetical protein EW026_g4857 [Hermanssonia centrifuga]